MLLLICYGKSKVFFISLLLIVTQPFFFLMYLLLSDGIWAASLKGFPKLLCETSNICAVHVTVIVNVNPEKLNTQLSYMCSEFVFTSETHVPSSGLLLDLLCMCTGTDNPKHPYANPSTGLAYGVC